MPILHLTPGPCSAGAARLRAASTALLLGLGAAVLLVSLLTAGAARADQWTGTLKGGGQVSVDPRSNRVVVERNGVQTQLWDGVHRLRDGSSITVRSGQVVPNRQILRAREERGLPEEGEGTSAEMWIGAPIVGHSPCEKLVRRVCGEDQECAEREGCTLARQLLQMEEQERAADVTPNRMTYASGQCQEGDRDRDFFASCGAEPAQLSGGAEPRGYVPPSPCQTLADKVCGRDGACSAETACDAARQLLRMAQEEREPAVTGAMSTPTDHNCTEALADESFFAPCPR